MISKTPARGALSRGFVGLYEYLKNGKDRSAPDRADWVALRNVGVTDPELAPAVMQKSAARGRTEKPVYHRIVSLAEGEHLSRSQMEQVADRLLAGLGLEEHQVLIAQHSDNGKQHLHLVVNRVHPETGRVWNASHDYAKVERALRGLERELGLKEVRGRHWAEPGRERLESSRTSREPFAERAGRLVSDVLGKASSWQELHAGLAQHGLSIEPDRRNRGLVLTDGRSWVAASRVSRSASRGALEKRLGPYQRKSRDLERLKEKARALGSWKAVEQDLLGRSQATQRKWGIFTARDRERQYSKALDAAIEGAYRNPAVARRRIERGLVTDGWRQVRRNLEQRPETLGRLRGRGRPFPNRRRKEARAITARLVDYVQRWRLAERGLARSEFARSVRKRSSGAFREAGSWVEVHAGLRRERLQLLPSRTGKSLVVTDGRASIPTYQLDRRFGKKALEQRLGEFERSSHALDRLAHTTRQLFARQRLDKLLTRHRSALDRAESRLGAVAAAERAVSKTRRALQATTRAVFREPKAAIQALERYEREAGRKKARLAALERPERFGRLRGGRLVGSGERKEALELARRELPHRLADLQAARRRLVKAEREQPTLRRAARRSKRAIRRLKRVGERLAPRKKLVRQAERLVGRLGWTVVARLLPVPQYQALRIVVSLARKATVEMTKQLGR